MSEIVITVTRNRGAYEAVIEYGNITLSSIRNTEADARAAVLAMYEDALFGCNRYVARAARNRGTMSAWSP